MLFFPLAFCAGGVAAVRSFYKSSRGAFDSFPPALAQKALASCSPCCRLLQSIRKLLTLLAAMAGDDAWHPSNVTRSVLDARVKAWILHPITDAGLLEWIAPSVNNREPNPPLGYVVCFLSFLDRGFGTSASRLIRAILHFYEVELHNLNPNSMMQAAVFATVCEGFLGVPPHWNLWLHLFKADMSARYEGGEKIPLRVGGCTLQLRQARSHQYIWSTMPLSNRGWQSGWFYLRNDGGLLPGYTGKTVTECPPKWAWGAPAEEQKRLAPPSCGAREAA